MSLNKILCAVVLMLPLAFANSNDHVEVNTTKEAEYSELIQQALFDYTSGTQEGYVSAFNKAKMALDKDNDPIASRLLATMYFWGRGVKQDKSAALDYYLMASDDDSEAAYMAGKILLVGDGVEADVWDGVELIRQAAEMGSINAQVEMARNSLDQSMLEDDVSVKLMLEKTSLYYGKQCAAKVSGCRQVLSYIFENGLAGLPVSKRAAIELSNIDN